MEKKQCNGCIYWRAAGGAGLENCCHCLLDTGKRRVRDGEKCLSYTPDNRKCRKDVPEVRS